MNVSKLFVVAALVAVPALSFAQTSTGLTRAQVRAELVALEKAGYNPATSSNQYPADIQAANARVEASQQASYGGVKSETSASGAHGPMTDASPQQSESNTPGLGPIYAHS